MSEDEQRPRVPRFQIRGVMGALTTPREAEVLDLSLRGALVEHQGVLRVDAACFLDLPTSGGFFTIRCRVVHSRVSRREPDGVLYYQTGVKFLNVGPEDEQPLEALIRSYGARKDQETGGL